MKINLILSDIINDITNIHSTKKKYKINIIN